MTQTCKNCEFWGVDYDGVCDFPNRIAAEDEATRFEVEATADDDSGLEVRLFTGPDFGCVQFGWRRK